MAASSDVPSLLHARRHVASDEVLPAPVVGSTSPDFVPPTPVVSSTSTGSIVIRSYPLGGSGPTGGFLYIRVVEVGNFKALAYTPSCCGVNLQPPSSDGAEDIYESGCCTCDASCWSLGCCTQGGPEAFLVGFSCLSLERSAQIKVGASVTAKDGWEILGGAELLLRSLNFCSADRMQVRVETVSGAVVGEASIPLRAALPQMLRDEPGRCAAPHEAWPPRQRVFLRPPGGHNETVLSIGSSDALVKSAGREPQGPPYLDLELLHLVDSSLPGVVGTEPLLLAVQNGQEQLVRGYLSFDYAVRLSRREQAACVAATIERNSIGLLVQLLDQIRPSHQHLIMAIRLGLDQLIEPLLQAGGPSLLRPCGPPRSASGAGSRTSLDSVSSRLRRGFADRQVQVQVPLRNSDDPVQQTLGSDRGQQAEEPDDGFEDGNGDGWVSSQPSTRRRHPVLTPLALACSLGDVKVVEALCQWARRQRVHVDPSAPFPTAGLSSRRGLEHPPGLPLGGRHTAGASANSPWLEHDDHLDQDGISKFGDPPMVMTVRGKGSLTAKLRLCAYLSHYGFSADARSPVDSWTPLLAAVDQGCIQLVTTLLKLGARLSSDCHLGFTPLHLACQMGHWHLIGCLVDAMKSQHDRVAAWGPSPQYVSLNLADAYGRTALDIALLKYFSNPFSASWESSNPGAGSKPGSEREKAVDVLREFVQRRLPEDAGSVVCSWELLQVLNLLDAMPAKKALRECERGPEGATVSRGSSSLPSASDGKELEATEPGYGDLEELLQAIRTLVRAGAQTCYLLPDLVQPCARAEGSSSDAAFSLRPRRGSLQFSPLDAEDVVQCQSDDECSAL